MDELLRDGIWQFVGALVGIISLGAMILIFLWQRQRKGFAYEVISSTSLLNIAEEIDRQVQIKYDNKPVQQMYLFVLKLMNSSKSPILENDYVRPVKIAFSSITKILSADISKEKPDDIGAKIEYSDNTVTLQPVMLNGGDSITIKCLLSDFDYDFSVEGRIVGVKRIKNTDEVNLALIIPAIAVSLIMMLIIAIYAMKIIADVIQFGDYMALLNTEPMFRRGFLFATQSFLFVFLLTIFLKILRYAMDRITQFSRPTSPRPDC